MIKSITTTILSVSKPILNPVKVADTYSFLTTNPNCVYGNTNLNATLKQAQTKNR